MRTKTFLAGGLAAIALTAAVAGCSDSSAGSPTATPSTAAMPSAAAMPMSPISMSPMPVSPVSGTFAGANGKSVAGKATVSGQTVTLTGFSSDKGPDLHLYLAEGTSESDVSAGVELGSVAADTAQQTFTIPSGTDTSTFTDVVVHCDKAKAVFGAAALTK